jgi:hypothetical protein
MGENKQEKKKLSYDEFLKKVNQSNKKLREMRDDKRQSGGNFSKPSPFAMKMRYWRPEDTARWVRLIPWSTKEEFFTFYQSWVKVNGQPRTVLCNCSGGEKEIPCVPCYIAATEEKPDILPARKDAITVTVLEEFHKVKRKSRAGNEYTAYEACQGVDRYNKSQCEYCDDETEKVFGNQYYWTLGYGHKMQLQDELMTIREACANCHDGFVSEWGYACEKCGAIIASHKDSELSEEDVEILRTSDELVCPECEHAVKATPLTECVHKQGSGSQVRWVDGCDNPVRVESIWDLEFLVKTAGSETSTIVIEDWRPANEEGLKDHLLRTMDFPYFLAYQDLEDQARSMGRDNPFGEDVQKKLEEHFKVAADEASDEKHTESYDKDDGTSDSGEGEE